MTDNKDFLTPKEEQMLRQFFTEHKQAIPDDGFSRRVIRQLPVSPLRLERIWTALCVTIGIVIFFALGSARQVIRPLVTYLYRCWEHINMLPDTNFSLVNAYYTYVMAAAALLIFVGYKALNDH